MGELLVDVPGALWKRDQLDRLRRSQAPTSLRIVVAIDPSGTGGEEADECGIVAAGIDEDGRGWVLADASGVYQPTEWAKQAIGLYHRLHANCIVAETNFGGQMVEATIRAIDRNVAYRSVTASRGKVARAEPVAALYEQGRVHHLGAFATSSIAGNQRRPSSATSPDLLNPNLSPARWSGSRRIRKKAEPRRLLGDRLPGSPRGTLRFVAHGWPRREPPGEVAMTLAVELQSRWVSTLGSRLPPDGAIPLSS